MIDPDLVDIPDFITPFAADSAFGLRQARAAALEALKTDLAAVSSASPWEKIDHLLRERLGLDGDQLGALVEAANDGNLTSALLAQLTVSRTELTRLLGLRALAGEDPAGSAIVDTEWNDLFDILIQVEKRRRFFPKWRLEERDLGLVIGPDHFKSRPPEPPSLSPGEQHAWRSGAADRRLWDVTLQARMEQQESVILALNNAVGAAEAATLPGLRDHLITALSGPVKPLSEAAKEIGKRLLIDMDDSGCQMTTRAAQAVVTLQMLLWSLRTGQIGDAWPDLSLDAEDFDEEWKWLGAYGTWRGAMMVFLYPENLLLPRLRKQQTPAFSQLLQKLQLTGHVTPEDACHSANDYSSYFRDVCNLALEASCWAISRANTTVKSCGSNIKEERNLLFLFARSKVSNKIYWSTYDPNGESDHAQPFWLELPTEDFNGIVELIGAIAYRFNGHYYLYLYALRSALGKREVIAFKLDLTKLDLVGSDENPWDEDAIIVPLPQEVNRFTAVILHSPYERSNESPGTDLPDVYIVSEYTFQNDNLWLNGNKLYRYKLDLEQNAFVEQFPGTLLDPSYQETYKILFAGYYNNSGDLFKHTLVYLSEASEPYPLTLSRSTWSPLPDQKILSMATYTGAFTWSSTGGVYVFIQGLFGKSYAYLRPGPANALSQNYEIDSVSGSPFNSSAPLFRFRMVPVNGSDDNTLVVAANQRNSLANYDPHQGLFVSRIMREKSYELRVGESVRVAPKLKKAKADESITTAGTDIMPGSFQNAFAGRSQLIRDAVNLSAIDGSSAIMTYLEEAYCFVPLLIAQNLQRSVEFQAALDWYRSLYDYTAPNEERWVLDGLALSAEQIHFQKANDWLMDPMDAHAIASTREGSHKRHILLSLIRCLLEYADAEFCQDTLESNIRARQLYTQAVELLNAPELARAMDPCDKVITEVVDQIGELPQIEIGQAMETLSLLDVVALNHAREILWSILATGETQEKKAEKVRKVLNEAKQSSFAPTLIADHINSGHSSVRRAHRALLAQSEVRNWVRPNPGDHVGAPNPSSSSWIPRSFAFCIPINPMIKALRLHAELNLYKLRTCRNIAGLERDQEPYSAPTDATGNLPAIGTGGRITIPGTFQIRPTQYRYRALAERAKQLVGIAQQMEATFLSLLEKADAERYTLLRARQDARMARAGVRLQDLRVQESENGVFLADLQRERAIIQQEHFASLISADLLATEAWALNLLILNATLQFAVGTLTTGGAIAAGFVAGSAIGAESGPGAIVTALAGGSAAAALAMSLSQSAYSSITGGIATTSSALSMIASYERRMQEWIYQKNLAEHDRRIATQQITLAGDRVRITGQEREIARLQADHTDDAIEFLTTKFTSAELYDWMSGVMEGVYRYFLQQATGMARLAENQLAFERQEMPSALIQADYWEALRDGGRTDAGDDGTPDRRGLTGSSRLLQDIYRLDQYAFETDRRKLQLTKTISLARLDPFAFQQLRETGVMVFCTPMALFDRDFPGHYLRLIKRVRTSVIALIPPVEGIKATLSTAGISRVVIGGDLFQTTLIQREPESVALSSPQNATGLFELEAQGQGEMLLPFEGLGVDTTWEFRLPKPANAFDFRTIADVLVTLDYTALDSPTYRQQVISQLDRSMEAERAFSLRHQFPDAWYDLHHSDLVQAPQQPMRVSFATRQEDFPPNITDLRIAHVTLYIARKPGITEDVDIDLKFVDEGGPGAVGGSAATVNGVAGTRQGGAGAWTAMIGRPPAGTWTLALQDTPETRQLFAKDRIEDILFVITFIGTTEAWPG